jgi:hypothetical protein
MRRAVMLVLFALLPAAITAQTPAGAGNTPPVPTQPAVPGAQQPGKGEDTQRAIPSANPAPEPQQASPSGTQASPSPTNQAAVNDQIAAGAEIRATLDTPLSTKTSKPGDRFTATITEPARGAAGATVIPAGTRVEGEVAELEEGKTLPALRDKPNLSLRFRDLVLPTGQTLPLSATLISVNTTGRNAKKSDEEGQLQSGARSKDVVRDAGIAAGAGTAVAPVFGGPLKGLAIAAMAGGGYVLSTKGKEVNLPAQIGMVIRLDQPVSSTVASPR